MYNLNRVIKFMENPFKYGCIVTGDDFCDRPELVGQLKGYIQSGQNAVVYGERRVGKTSVVFHAASKSKPRKPLVIDFMGIKSADSLLKRILRAVVAQEKRKGVLAAVLKRFAAIRPTLSLDPVTALPTVSFDASLEMKAESIGEAIGFIKDLYGESKVVVIIDEFQDVLDLPESQEAMAVLRGAIQYQTNIPYIFVGSVRHRMDAIFATNDSPFFKSAIPLEVGLIPKDKFIAFISRKMKKGKRNITSESIDRIFEITNSITGDVQQLCEALWNVSRQGDKIDAGSIQKALALIFSRERNAYENYVRLATNLQFKSLVAIARNGGKNIFSIDFMKAGGFNNASSLRRCVQRLITLNILFEYKGEYRFVNPFFRAWIMGQG